MASNGEAGEEELAAVPVPEEDGYEVAVEEVSALYRIPFMRAEESPHMHK